MAVDISKFLVPDDRDYIAELGALDSAAYLATPRDLNAQVWKSISEPERGLRMPWPECDLLQFVPRRWSVWSGYTFAGKTQLLRFLMGHALRIGQKVLIASPEEDPWEFLKELILLAAGTRRNVTESFVEFCCEYWTDKLWIFTPSGFIDPFHVLGAICYVARKHGLDHAVIDSLMKLDIRKDDWDGQRKLANTFDRVVRQMNLHLHLVAHPTKQQGRGDHLMGIGDIGGAQDITSLAHTIVIVDRIRQDPSGQALRTRYGIPEDVDALLRATKQRGDHNIIGTVPLYFDKASRQHKYRRNDPLIRLMDDAVYGFCEMPIPGYTPQQESFA